MKYSKLILQVMISSHLLSVISYAAPSVAHAALETASSIVEDTQHPLHAAVTQAHQFVLPINNGSGILMQSPLLKGVNLMVTARHVVFDLKRQNAEEVGHSGLAEKVSNSIIIGTDNLFSFYRVLALPLSRVDVLSSAYTLAPEFDFALGIVAKANAPVLREANSLEKIKEFIRTEAEKPAHVLDSTSTYFFVGYPKNTQNGTEPTFAGAQWVSSGKALTSMESAQLLGKNSEDGFVSSIAFNPEVEFVIKAPVYIGFSGGGVFSSQGELVGISVRAVRLPNGESFLRVLRIASIWKTASQALKLPKNPTVGP